MTVDEKGLETLARIIDPMAFSLTPEHYGTDKLPAWPAGMQQVARDKARAVIQAYEAAKTAEGPAGLIGIRTTVGGSYTVEMHFDSLDNAETFLDRVRPAPGAP